MIEFLNKLFGRQSSGATAKERLRLVLMSDHISLAPEMIEAMKRDLVDVISRYVEVDRDRIDVHFEHQDQALAMLANIPITAVHRNGNAHTNGHAKVTAAEPDAAAFEEHIVCHADLLASGERGVANFDTAGEAPRSGGEAKNASQPAQKRGPRRKRKKAAAS